MSRMSWWWWCWGGGGVMVAAAAMAAAVVLGWDRVVRCGDGGQRVLAIALHGGRPMAVDGGAWGARGGGPTYVGELERHVQRRQASEDDTRHQTRQEQLGRGGGVEPFAEDRAERRDRAELEDLLHPGRHESVHHRRRDRQRVERGAAARKRRPGARPRSRASRVVQTERSPRRREKELAYVASHAVARGAAGLLVDAVHAAVAADAMALERCGGHRQARQQQRPHLGTRRVGAKRGLAIRTRLASRRPCVPCLSGVHVYTPSAISIRTSSSAWHGPATSSSEKW